MTRSGQNARITFSATAGQVVTLTSTNATIPDSVIAIVRSDDTWLVSTSAGPGGTTIDALQIPATGTYAVWVDPNGIGVGTMTLQLTSP